MKGLISNTQRSPMNYHEHGCRENEFSLPIARERLVSSVYFQTRVKLNLGEDVSGRVTFPRRVNLRSLDVFSRDTMVDGCFVVGKKQRKDESERHCASLFS